MNHHNRKPQQHTANTVFVLSHNTKNTVQEKEINRIPV
uniref:Uncharacterized protein n=1 Tax=Anguilla anguilla TaxID=7936 RepID=A0A0E9UDG2_ANGAN